jgi:hypothetical protein
VALTILRSLSSFTPTSNATKSRGAVRDERAVTSLAYSPRSRSSEGFARCGLTHRSSEAPTAGRQARSGGTRYILDSPGLGSYRCLPPELERWASDGS